MKLNSNPLVSIVIPVYKVEKYLQDSVNSAINQTYNNIEIILVNDGSPDRCPEICEDFASKYEKVTVIHKENGGLSEARNFGQNQAKGEYILFLDSDDKLLEDAIEGLLKIALEKNADMVIPDRYNLVIEGQNNFRQIHHFHKPYFFEDPKQFALNVMISKGRAWRAHSLLYKTSVIRRNKIEFPIGYIAEDIPFNLSFLSHAKKIAFYEVATVNYLKRGGSITTTFQENLDEVFLFIDMEVEKFLENNNMSNTENEIKRNQLLSRNIITFILNVFSNKCNWSKKEKNEKLNQLLRNERVIESFKINKIEMYTEDKKTRSNMKSRIYGIIFYLLKFNKKKSAFRIAEFADKLR